MKFRNIVSWCVLFISLVLFVSGVVKKIAHKGNVSAGKSQVIAVIPKGTASMWWEVVHKGANDAGKEFGYEIAWNGPENETDREKQIQVVEDAINKNAAAIVLGPNDFTALARPVENISALGTPCIIIDSAVDTEKYDAFVGTDNIAGGADAARVLGKALNGKGNLLLIRFVQNSASTDARAKGFVDTVEKEFPGLKILSEQYTQGTVEDARQKTVDLLTRYPEVDGIFAVNQPTSVGTYKAIQNQGLVGKVKFVAFDSDATLVSGIEEGGVTAVIAQDPYMIGYIGVRSAVDKMKGNALKRNVPVPSMIVTSENLEKCKQENATALGL